MSDPYLPSWPELIFQVTLERPWQREASIQSVGGLRIVFLVYKRGFSEFLRSILVSSHHYIVYIVLHCY